MFGKVDTEDQQQLAATFNIMSIPTLMIFRENVLVFSQPGALPAEALENLIEQVRALDMDEVHKAVAEHEAEHDHARPRPRRARSRPRGARSHALIASRVRAIRIFARTVDPASGSVRISA